jgi:hypothetical protein
LATQFQNQEILTIQQLKPFTFDHLVVFIGGFTVMDDKWQWDSQGHMPAL